MKGAGTLAASSFFLPSQDAAFGASEGQNDWQSRACTTWGGVPECLSAARLRREIGSVLRTVPGRYYEVEKNSRRPKDLVAKSDARAVLGDRSLLNNGPICERTNGIPEEGHRFMASTALPWLNREALEADAGVSCAGCRIRIEPGDDFQSAIDRAFSQAGYLVHFATRRESRRLWEQSRDGTVDV